MVRKFKKGEVVTILGTDGAKACVSQAQASNTDLYLVFLENPEAVYPYEGAHRLYPESMLEKCWDK